MKKEFFDYLAITLLLSAVLVLATLVGLIGYALWPYSLVILIALVWVGTVTWALHWLARIDHG